jgi:Family of unknown function (DUF6289)
MQEALMKSSGHTRRSSTLFSVLVLIVFLFALAVVSIPKANAYIPRCGTGELRRTFFSDSSHTTIVGYWVYYCDCTISSEGQRTGYFTEELLPCP